MLALLATVIVAGVAALIAGLVAVVTHSGCFLECVPVDNGDRFEAALWAVAAIALAATPIFVGCALLQRRPNVFVRRWSYGFAGAVGLGFAAPAASALWNSL